MTIFTILSNAANIRRHPFSGAGHLPPPPPPHPQCIPLNWITTPRDLTEDHIFQGRLKENFCKFQELHMVVERKKWKKTFKLNYYKPTKNKSRPSQPRCSLAPCFVRVFASHNSLSDRKRRKKQKRKEPHQRTERLRMSILKYPSRNYKKLVILSPTFCPQNP